MEYRKIGLELEQYCKKHKIPFEFVFYILEDQKVVPMIRGKATEYSAYLRIKELLPDTEWSVQKLNLNAQPNHKDEDITVTHLRTGVAVKLECKNATRASFKSGKGCRNVKEPHCTVKCHKSRSTIKLASTTNDRYSADMFDVVVTNLSNAIIASATYSSSFELIPKPAEIKILCSHYGVPGCLEDLFDATYHDWRFARTSDLAEGGYIPRTPILRLYGNDAWHPIIGLEACLLEIVKEKLQKKTR